MTKTLPHDPHNRNNERADTASEALRQFQLVTGTDDEDALGDLLCNLIHWCDRNNFDFEAALLRARMHYEAETEEAPS
jgi:hypothetical protein